MNLESLLKVNPVVLALLAALFTWAVTAMGAAMVFSLKDKQESIKLNVGFCCRGNDCCQFLVVA